ncbi:hypothetical protein ACQEVF_24610 [Nonomuraea polychroma]|uniref:hypothetical protein n=1 Tax=Nonomuraea polychroma TaxID=46176 RepID=UPI003D8F2601
MRHDPERDAAAYLADELGLFARLRFERHMLDCDDCWQEANTAREGRMLAESLRQVAPPSTRERIRAVAECVDVQTSPRIRWPYLLAAGAAAVLIVLAAVLVPLATERGPTGTDRGSPAPLTAAAQLLESDTLSLSSEPAPVAKRIGAYDWRGTAQRDVAGIPATIYSYTDPAGHQILVLASTREFPRAAHARDLEPAPSWLATVNGASLLCADRAGMSWLAVAADDATALTAGRSLGLT